MNNTYLSKFIMSPMKYSIFVLLIICGSFFDGFAQNPDTLYAKRVFLATHIYKDGIKLSSQKLTKIFITTEQSKLKYKWSNILKPIGPVVAVGGVGLAYIALKGKDATAIVEGTSVDYKVRSKKSEFFLVFVIAHPRRVSFGSSF